MVSAGQLLLTNGWALGSTAVGTTVASGARLALSGGLTYSEPLTVSGTGPDGLGAVYAVSGTNVLAGASVFVSATSLGAATGAALIIAFIPSGPGPLVPAPGTPGQVAVNPVLEYSISIGGMTVGETAGSSVGVLSADSTWIAAASWQDAVQTAVSGYTGPTSGTSKYYFPGSRYVVGDAATLSATIANNSLAGLVSGQTKVIGYEDSTDNDFDDDYWVVTANVRARTATTLSASPASAVFGQAVTLSAHVQLESPASGTVPGGTVSFWDGTTWLGDATVDSSGDASIATSTLPVGGHTVTASYAGYGVFAGSTSDGKSVTVAKASTTTVLTSDATGGRSTDGTAVTFTAAVTAVAPGAGTPSGTVDFYDGTNYLGYATVSGGMASFTTDTLSVNTHTITASYQGSADFDTSSASLTHTVDT